MRQFIAIAAGALALAAVAAIPSNATASTYWSAGVRTSNISVCFVGDALTSRPERVAQVIDRLDHFEHAANIRFDVWGSCPASVPLRNGDDSFDGDIRVVLPGVSGTKLDTWDGSEGTGPIPGEGCTAFFSDGTYNGRNDGWGSWSNSPNALADHRACLYNLKLGDDPWNDDPYLDHQLHEFGHALGLSHEHARKDADREACPGIPASNGTSGWMTPYDPRSVMHYSYKECGIEGNYGHNGLSTYDQLGLHILYPEVRKVTEVDGRTVVRSNEAVQLVSSWKQRGANMSVVSSSFAWFVDGQPRSASPTLTLTLPLGKHTLSVKQTDFLGRNFTWDGEILVLTPSNFRRRIAALGR